MIRVVTDSTADLSLEEGKNSNIDIVPLYVIFGEDTYKDRVDITTENFYEMQKSSDSTTSQPSPSDFLSVFDNYPDDEIICITCTKKLSGTYQSAKIASEMSKNKNIYVVDSTIIGRGLGMLVLEAARLRDCGFGVEDILERVENIKKRSVTIGMLDELDYLKKGGRISAVSATLGSVFKIKPILCVSDGVIQSYNKKVRGKQNAMKFMASIVDEAKLDDSLPICVCYSGKINNALQMVKKLEEINIKIDIENNCKAIGPVIGTHLGPTCVMVSFFTV